MSGKKGSAKSRPTTSQILKTLHHDTASEAVLQKKREEIERHEQAEANLKLTHLDGWKDHYHHKNLWSWFLMWIMALLVIFQIVLLSLVGFEYWTFKDYNWLLPTLLVQNFAQIIGLAVFVVKSLFKDLD